MRSIHLTKHFASHLWSIHVIVKNSILDIGKNYNRCEQAFIYKSDVILLKQVWRESSGPNLSHGEV